MRGGGEERVGSEIEPHLQRWKETRGLNGLILLTQGATEDRSRQQRLSVQQQTAGGEQCLEKPSGDAPKRGNLDMGCAALVSLWDEVGHVQDDTGRRRTLPVPKRHRHAHGCDTHKQTRMEWFTLTLSLSCSLSLSSFLLPLSQVTHTRA